MNVIRQAIEQRRVLSFSYETSPRTVIPAALGVHRSSGNLILRAYQIAGATESGRLPLWRMFTVSDMVRVTILDETFEESPRGYRRGDRTMSQIMAQL